MATQATRLDGSRSGTGTVSSASIGPIQGVTQGASSVLNDAFDLAELQGKLVAADAKLFVEQTKLAIVGLVLTLALLLASLPVVAIGLAELLSWGLEWPRWICQLAVGLFFTVMGLALGLWCAKRLKKSLLSFKTSKQEASENIRWLRQALSKSFSN